MLARKQKRVLLNAQETGPASLQVTYNWHLSFIDNHWTSDNASSFTPTLIKMAQNPWQNQARGIDFKTATWHCHSVKLSNCFQTWPSNWKYLSGLVNSDKKIHKMAPNGWHLSIGRILNGCFPWLENTILHFLRLLIKVPFSRFWQHHFQLPRFFALLRTSLPTAKKVPFCAFHEIAWNRKKGTSFAL